MAEQVKVKLTKACLVNGKHTPEDKEVAVSVSDARVLVGLKRAEYAEAKAQPKAAAKSKA